MKNTEETRDANEDKQPHPKVQLARALTGDGRVVVSGATVLKLELVVLSYQVLQKLCFKLLSEKKRKKKRSRLKDAFSRRECDGRAALENEIRFSGYHELFVTFQRVDIYFPRKKKARNYVRL